MTSQVNFRDEPLDSRGSHLSTVTRHVHVHTHTDCQIFGYRFEKWRATCMWAVPNANTRAHVTQNKYIYRRCRLASCASPASPSTGIHVGRGALVVGTARDVLVLCFLEYLSCASTSNSKRGSPVPSPSTELTELPVQQWRIGSVRVVEQMSRASTSLNGGRCLMRESRPATARLLRANSDFTIFFALSSRWPCIHTIHH